MAAGSRARLNTTQQIGYIQADLAFGDMGVAKVVGIIPAGSMILKPVSGVQVRTAFNAETTNTIDIGTSADGDLYGTALAGGTVAFVPIDEAVDTVVADDTTITATFNSTGTDATAGAARVVIAYIPANG